MVDRLNEIQTAIDNFQMDQARQLIRDEMQNNPSAELYYLASQAAVNHGQRIEFLKKAIELVYRSRSLMRTSNQADRYRYVHSIFD